jgi:A/G-specific adenine glycosylase
VTDRGRSPSGPALPERLPGALLTWFDRHRRPLPWRATRDPYRIWVAEVLLQQTRVAQASPYFERFVRRFPDLPTLARAPLRAVLKVWEGAGYYARARHLHAAARELVRSGARQPPGAVEEFVRLPGVGPYIARAVLSLAYGVPEVALEANGLRVAARLLREEGDPRSARVRARLATALAEQLPRDRPGAFNEAVMELGETVCTPRNPHCPACPVAFACRAYRELPDPGSIPRRRGRRPRPHARAAVVVLEERGRWLVQRRPEGGLLGGLWEFPGGRIEPGELPIAAARRELREETGRSVRSLRPAGVVRHSYSHLTVELHVFRGAPGAHGPTLGLGPERRWLTPTAFARLPRPKATEKIVSQLVDPGRTPRTDREMGRAGTRESSRGGARRRRPRRRRARSSRRALPRTPSG